MANNIFPEGSYFGMLFDANPDLIIEIRPNMISVYSGDHGKSGYYPDERSDDDVEKMCQDIAESIKDLM